MKIAVEGCMHGDLDIVYQTIQHVERLNGIKIDLLLCCGDFQAVRNARDMESLNVPPKYREMKSFWKYYSGQEVAPIPTIFIGGNHEASNYLWELYYGGWAAPNIYFLGFAGVVKFGNIRIGGLSGIYSARDYHLGHHERPPYNERTIRSVYHVREYDVHKLMQVEEPIDIFLSHDWPLGITDCGNWQQLVRHKRHFENEIRERTLGSKAAAQLLEKLRPPYWFSAHLHCKFAAVVQHGESGPTTKFLALDKCLPRRKFLQIIDIESEPGPYEIQYDEEWLAITRKFNPIFPLTFKNANFGGTQLEMQDCQQWVRSRLQARGPKPFEFAQTVPSFDPSQPDSNNSYFDYPRNPQTESLLQLLELPYLLDSVSESRVPTHGPTPLIQGGIDLLYWKKLGIPDKFLQHESSSVEYSEEIPIDDADEVEEFAEIDDVETGNE
ncbi:lariat debranching enzyme isoform X1 [Hevea brasiliensis]|uniref:lariat debranching enzyme isoform X1 n=1 Tax=Hevea brasiliensis TaxID=3981 RepID=UPI0025D833BF|nr:lariat debranching enzyme isoform X1 [Hevea brasiliensis]XP_058002119.1 lariat debranching enzyme isoform X1 [Hevea brasiliensis]